MNVGVLDIDVEAAPNLFPNRFDPLLLDVTIKQDVEMGISVLLEFEYYDVARSPTETLKPFDIYAHDPNFIPSLDLDHIGSVLKAAKHVGAAD